MSNHDKDVEILTLRHQITVLQRQLGPDKPRFEPADRALLAAPLHRLPRTTPRELRLLIRPDTPSYAGTTTPSPAGTPPLPGPTGPAGPARRGPSEPSYCGWCEKTRPRGNRPVHGELLVLGMRVAASTAWEILHTAGIDPAPDRACSTSTNFLHSKPRHC